MYISENINKIDFSLYEQSVDMILHALELYSYNLHYLVKQGTDEYYYHNMLILHTYNEIMVNYRDNHYECGYNPVKNCQLEIDRYKKKNKCNIDVINISDYFSKNMA